MAGLIAAAAAYNESASVQDLWLVQATACDPSKISSWSCGLACSKASVEQPRLVRAEKLNVLAIVAKQDEGCIVAFRGSSTALNWIEDFDFFPAKYGPDCDGCEVHGGFLRNWDAVAPQIRGNLTALGCAGRPLNVIGHSLGGAMSVIAAHELGLNYTVKRVQTYGQPRVGNPQFAAAFTARLGGAPFYRVVDYGDAVPHLPFENMLWEGWPHFGAEAYYNATRLGAYTICTEPADKHCSAQWNIVQSLFHTCDHCSYLGMNPCDCGSTTPQCTEPKKGGRLSAEGAFLRAASAV